VGIAQVDPSGRWLRVNQKLCDIVGYSREELLQKSFQEITHPDDLATDLEYTRQVLAGEIQTYAIEKRYLRQDGSLIWINLTVSLVRDLAGKPDYFISVVQDITQRKAVEEEVRRLKEFNEEIVQGMTEGIAVEDAAGYFTFVNPAAAAMLGYTIEELTGQPWTLIIPPEQQARVREMDKRRAQGQTDQYELDLVRKDGARLPVLVSGSPRFEGGKFAGTLAIFTDISQRAQAEREVRRRNRELALLNRIIAASAADLKVEALLELACRELAQAFELPLASAILLNPDKTSATIVAEYRSGEQQSLLNQTYQLADLTLLQDVLAHKVPVVVENVQSDPRLGGTPEMIRRRGTVSMLVLPLLVSDAAIGALTVSAQEIRLFSEAEINLAWRVAEQVAGALARLRLHQERRQLEEQYYQAQKMEAIGQLTAGVAHDFNNLLTAINGFAELIKMELLPADPLAEMIDKILHSGERAARLVSQLLAFSRKQIIAPQLLELNYIVDKLGKILPRIIGEHIEVKTSLDPDLGLIKADSYQIEQVIVNLAVNARDAMPQGGHLVIETANAVLDENFTATHLGVQPGDYILLSVSDTGSGMSEEVKAHLFEPFFTTKELGKGTGLGLATVYGIVKQNGGHIWVYSEVGLGATFKIYLPRVRDTELPSPQPKVAAEMPRGSETLLLVEDDMSVRELAQRVLEAQGYTVLVAPNGQAALELAGRHLAPIPLLLTDVVMPGMSGKVLAEQLVQTRPDLKVLFMSGYTDEAIAYHGILIPGVSLLQKPFSPINLARKVREVLNS
jgi:PAS domain S-box-containing protein